MFGLIILVQSKTNINENCADVSPREYSPSRCIGCTPAKLGQYPWQVVLVERSVEAGGEYGSLRRRDGGLLAAAVEGADAGDLLRHREGRQRPLRPRVGAGHADRRQGRTPV